MFCSHCGSKVVSPETRFCPNCGSELNKANKDEPEHQAKVFAPKNQQSVPLELTRFGGIILILLVVALVGMYAAVLIPAFGGIRPQGQYTMGPIFWTSILCYILFRRSGKKGWKGAIVGIVLGFIVLGIVDGIAKTKQNDLGYILLHSSPVFLAIQKYDPAVFQRMKTEMEALAKESGGVTQRAMLSKLEPMMTETLQKALTQTTDEAIVQYARRKVVNLEKVANASENDCSSIFSKQDNPGIDERLITYIPEQDQKEINIATVGVIENAAGRPQQSLNDSARLDRLMAPIELKMHTSGLSIKYLISDTPELTPKKRCRSGIHLFREALNLNDPDRAYLLRMLLTQWL